MRNVTLAAIQPPLHRTGNTLQERKADNLRIAFTLMDDAARRGADLICLPEHFPVTGLLGGLDAQEKFALTDAEDGDLATRLRHFARQHRVNIVAPVLGRYGDIQRNVAWVISREGEFVGRYFKVHPTCGERQKGVVPGDEWPVFDLDIGKVGVMTCIDNDYPESARSLALNGAEIICWPHVESAWGDIAWDITLRSRAIDNAVYILSSCYGVPPGTAWRPGMLMGRSGVVGPDGTVLADGGRYPGVVMTDVDLDLVLLKHNFMSIGEHDFQAEMLENRRPDTYDALTREKVEAPVA